MRRQNRNKTYNYRYVQGLNRGMTLEQHLRNVLFESHRMTGDRLEPVPSGDSEYHIYRLINFRRQYSDMVCGMFSMFDARKNAEVIALAENEENLEPEQLTAPESDDGDRREFLTGRLYFGVSYNHVILVQSQALKDRGFEAHLNWLVDSTANRLQRGEIIELHQQVPLPAQKYLKQTRRLQIGAPVFRSEDEQAGSGSPGSVSSVSATVPSDGFRWLKALFSDDAIEAMNLDELGSAGEDIRVEVTIRRMGQHADEDPAVNTMEALATHLRHTNPEDLRLKVPGIGTVNGNELRLMNEMGTPHTNGVPDMENVFQNMRQWLRQCLENGMVEAEE